MIVRMLLASVAILAINASGAIDAFYWASITLAIIGGAIVGWLASSPRRADR